MNQNKKEDADIRARETTVLHVYKEEHSFSKSAGVVRDEKSRIVLTQAFCHNGHSLMNPDYQFDGYAGIFLLGLHEDEIFDIILSPIMHDSRKVSSALPAGTVVEISCPACKIPLPRIAPCGCVIGSFYRHIFLTKNKDIRKSIGICDSFGCPRSFLRDRGEIISEVRTDLMWQAMDKYRMG